MFIQGMILSQNPILESLRCYTNNLTQLNIANGNNTMLENFLAYENPDLTCIQVDDEEFANSQLERQKDPWAFYSEDCALSSTDFENEFQITLFPNPVQETLFIESANPLEGTIAVIDMQGRIILLSDGSNSVAVSQLLSGVYFLKIASEGNIILKKFIKK
jgi:hypothetical protein